MKVRWRLTRRRKRRSTPRRFPSKPEEASGSGEVGDDKAPLPDSDDEYIAKNIHGTRGARRGPEAAEAVRVLEAGDSLETMQGNAGLGADNWVRGAEDAGELFMKKEE